MPYTPLISEAPVFLSFHKGLITWYPVVLVAVVLSLVARRRDAVILWVATTVPLVLLYGAWYPWDLGGGFGHRGFVDLAPVYGIVLAVSLQRSTVPLRFAGAASGLRIIQHSGTFEIEQLTSSQLRMNASRDEENRDPAQGHRAEIRWG